MRAIFQPPHCFPQPPPVRLSAIPAHHLPLDPPIIGVALPPMNSSPRKHSKMIRTCLPPYRAPTTAPAQPVCRRPDFIAHLAQRPAAPPALGAAPRPRPLMRTPPTSRPAPWPTTSGNPTTSPAASNKLGNASASSSKWAGAVGAVKHLLGMTPEAFTPLTINK